MSFDSLSHYTGPNALFLMTPKQLNIGAVSKDLSFTNGVNETWRGDLPQQAHCKYEGSDSLLDCSGFLNFI